ncbi:MAG TPA: hypothetical protein VGS27_10700 [Candidatus Sulfotelmatobacter sp.]|nr:hypothetical protein [Candidatus Sulfotelmatobacter sp.]
MKYLFWVASAIVLVLSGIVLRAQEPSANATSSDALPQTLPFAPMETAAAKPSVNLAQHSEVACSSNDLCNATMNFGEKVRYFAHQAFGTGAFVAPLFTAGADIGKPPAHYPRQWRQGPLAFGRLYGDALAFQTAEQTGRFLTGAALHEDPRYSPSTNHNPLARTMHALVFTILDRSDSARTTFALSNFVGAASAGFIGNAYLPHGYNNSSHAITRTGIAFGSFAITNVATEFSPELRRMGRRLHLPKFIVSRQPKE